MGLFDRSRPAYPFDEYGAAPAAPPVIPAGEGCDRCGFPATYRFGKTCLITVDTSPTTAYADLAVEVKQLDLVLCRAHGQCHAPALRLQGFAPLQVMTP